MSRREPSRIRDDTDLGPRKLKTLDVFDPDDIVVIESS